MGLRFHGPSVDMTPLSPDNYKYLHTYVISPDTKPLHCFYGPMRRSRLPGADRTKKKKKTMSKLLKCLLGALDYQL